MTVLRMQKEKGGAVSGSGMDQVVEKRALSTRLKIALGVVVAAMCISIGNIVAAAIHHSTGAQSAIIGSRPFRNTRTNAATAAALTPVDMKAVTTDGAPS